MGKEKEIKEAKSAVITVGEGRGFVVNGRAYFADGPHNRLIITAAHCLPFFPPCTGASYASERTDKELLGPIGSKPTVWAECLFADPVSDIAILGPPDNQAMSDHAAAFEALVAGATPLAIADVPEPGQGWMMSLEGKWFRCTFQTINDGPLWITETEEPIDGGMSGSPIISNDTAALGVVALSSDGPGACQNPDLLTIFPAGFCTLKKSNLSRTCNLGGLC